MDMSELVNFLRDRLHEVETTARAVHHQDWLGSFSSGEETVEVIEHVRRHEPFLVMDDVEAKLRIINLFLAYASACEENPTDVEFRVAKIATETVLKLLARPYLTHPDYREEWRP